MLRRYQQLLYGLLLGLLATGIILVVARRPPGHPVILKEPPTPTLLRVHVLGAVTAPGVYALPRGSIWQDAIQAAGGATSSADLKQINLAQLIAEGDQVNLPELIPTATPVPPTPTLGPSPLSPTPPKSAVTAASGNGSTTSASTGGIINLNTATNAELESLPRIGPAIAQRIIDYRTAHGPFAQIEDIQDVKGIGPATFNQIKDLITVS
jgi:competence protein ComEA